MNREKHKKVLFDEINEPDEQEQAQRRAQKGNRIRYIVYGALRWAIIVAGSLAGSLLLTVLISAVSQEKGILETAAELWDKFRRYLGVGL